MSEAPVKPRIVAVVGPTASGKSELALDLAEALDGEIINADAMQLYRGMDIGTAKLPVAERRGVPHYLLDVLDVTEEASLAAYQRDARAARDEILARGKLPILVGGSGLYVRAVLDQLEIPPTDPGSGCGWSARGRRRGAEEMHRRLAEKDPAAAIAILPGNLRRIVRALEVIELTGRPFSATLPSRSTTSRRSRSVWMLRGTSWTTGLRPGSCRCGGTGWSRRPVRLVSEGLLDGKTAPRALGYAQVLRMLEGELDEVEAQVDTVNSTRKFARRQESWFRRDQRVTWLPYGARICGLRRSRRSPARVALPRDHVRERPWHRERLRAARRPGSRVDLTPELIRHLADRRGGIGADGVIRVVRSAAAGQGARKRAPSGSWTTGTRTAAPPKCAATGFECSSPIFCAGVGCNWKTGKRYRSPRGAG